ncbi:hypothetical protein HA052_04740 [Chromobacterium haemolyticum]|uniref:DUF4942 domain-containing protein n=1 Tax=Chromobacterium fluminis TaxID=3044269 RepID=A0ABX0L4D1_9NEIS|nr:hypothetical protein [Chromobacterium haemolyticum]NHR04497.1 hypothetical protein [Chromobacterium haemolyticum]
MPAPKKACHTRMKLRHSPEMADETASLYPRVEEILRKTVTEHNSTCTAGECSAATRYLARSLAEFSLRKRKCIPDAKYNPEDEVYWREDRALKGDWVAATGFPDGSKQQEVMRQFQGELSVERINNARALRNKIKETLRWKAYSEGGARRALANAIRHAWLVCHDGNERINFGRRTDKHGDHTGPLHIFIKSVVALIPVHVNIDELHRLVRAISLELQVEECPDRLGPDSPMTPR